MDIEVAGHQPAQRSRAPQLVVVAAARVQADHQADVADAILEVVDVERQVVAAALLAALDDHHAAGVLAAVLAQCADRGQRTERGVAVVGAAAAVELVALDHRLPRAEVIVPTDHLGLLVEVAVEQHGVVDLAGDLHVDQRRAPLELHHLDRQAFDRLLLAPTLDQVDRLLDVAVGFPVRVEVRGLGGDRDVVDQVGDDRVVPDLADEVG